MADSLTGPIQRIKQRYAAALSQPGAPGAGIFLTDDAALLPPGPDNTKGAKAQDQRGLGDPDGNLDLR